MSVSKKMFPFRHELEQLWTKLSTIESFAIVRIMLLYAEFTREILNDEEGAHLMEEKADKLKSKMRD